ncbi:MAG: hypothetical protein AB7N71_01165 [Phycisphaerae bacterium]
MDWKDRPLRIIAAVLAAVEDVPAHRKRALIVSTAFFSALLLLLFVCLNGQRSSKPLAIVAAQGQPPAFLGVCVKCDARVGFASMPPRQNGVAQCESCGESACAIFRYGSQSIPPGGWSVVLESKQSTRREEEK